MELLGRCTDWGGVWDDEWDGSPFPSGNGPRLQSRAAVQPFRECPDTKPLDQTTGQLGGKRAASRSRDRPEARIALPHRPFAKTQSTYTLVLRYKCARVARSTVAMHPSLGPEQRPFSGIPPSLALVSAMLIGSLAGPCIPACLNPWPRPPPSFSLGPIISFHLSNAMQSMPACWPLLVCRLDEP